MILVIDVGNTNTVVGVLLEGKVVERWRISTISRTTDELGLLLLQLLKHRSLLVEQFQGVAVSCVVPSVLYAIEKAAKRYFNLTALVVSKGVRTGMRVRTDNPREVGADRIVNAVAAFERYKQAVIVVDFGTATTLDCVSSKGDYIGGAIAPGFRISAEALFSKTAKLPKVEVEQTEKVIGTNTIQSMQAGLYWGYVGLVEELAKRCKAEMRESEGSTSSVHCVATGGLSHLIGRSCSEIDSIDGDLTLYGLWLLFQRNR
ncbi:MAG: type III pantothenate kinase [Myxococcota bacterium]|nr:type III pantothenate kinase [Myxococcota bacterium]